MRVRRGVQISFSRPVLGDRRPRAEGDGHIELSEIRLRWPGGGGVRGEAFGFGAGGGVSVRGGVEGRGLRLGVACMSIGKAMKTSLPEG